MTARTFGPTRLVRAASLCRPDLDVYLKLETDLPTGTFKVRGAVHSLSVNIAKGPVAEVVAASTGNHGAAVAYGTGGATAARAERRVDSGAGRRCGDGERTGVAGGDWLAGGALGHRRSRRQGWARPPVPMPAWVKDAIDAIDAWTTAARITDGTVFRAVSKVGRVWGNGMTAKVLWDVVRAAAAQAGIVKPAAHDLRRTCARLCHLAGGELDQIQFLLGHVSIQTTERYLGCKQKRRHAVNDRLGLEPDAA